jgi:hypothetical protein
MPCAVEELPDLTGNQLLVLQKENANGDQLT